MHSSSSPFIKYKPDSYEHYNHYGYQKKYNSYRRNQNTNYKIIDTTQNHPILEQDTVNTKNTENTTPHIESTDHRSIFEDNHPLFEFLGIKLYFDDILLLCILLFLFQEGIQDEYLFISLILLLLS